MRFELPELPFERDALEPHISAETVGFHYDKHHQGYMDKLDKALQDKPERREDSLEEIILRAHKENDVAVFNPAAQVYNHNLYWASIAPSGSNATSSELESALTRDFGGVEEFKKEFSEKAAGQFGSGWTWLVFDNSRQKMSIISTSDAMTPIVAGAEPLLTLDVWEHAYYLDYQNRRADYIEHFLDHLINWELAEERHRALPKAA